MKLEKETTQILNRKCKDLTGISKRNVPFKMNG